MKSVWFVPLYLSLTTTLYAQLNLTRINQQTGTVLPAAAAQPEPKVQARIFDNYGKLPLSFEANHGQTDPRVKFLSRTSGYTLFLTGDEAVIAMGGKMVARNNSKTAGTAAAPKLDGAAPEGGGVLRMKLRNANSSAKVTGLDELTGTSNYLVGNDPAQWHTNIPTFGKVKYGEIYSGIDLLYYGNQRQLEYDFVVAPGADPHRIQFDIRGAKRIRQDEQGDLVFKMDVGEIRWHKPVVYQERNGIKQAIAARYAIAGANRVGFELGNYDSSRTLYIDPLIYSTYLGGSQGASGYAIAVDAAGSAYVTGTTLSTDFPVLNPLQSNSGGGGDVFVTKFDPAGSALVYSTYFGGSGSDTGSGIAVDRSGNAYITGSTQSTNFPVTSKAFQTTCGGGPNGCYDGFVAAINSTGSALVYSTYLGGNGNEAGNGIAVDSIGNAYVTGVTLSTNFPVTSGAFETTMGCASIFPYCTEGFVTKLTSSGSVVYSTFFGGSAGGYAASIAVDTSSNAYVTGSSSGTISPTPTLLPPSAGCNVLVAKINSAGSALSYSACFGGSADEDFSYGIALDSSDNAYIAGLTYSIDFPVTAGVFQPKPGDTRTHSCGKATCLLHGDAFVAKINSTGSALSYASYLGGNDDDSAAAIAADGAGNTYIIGTTRSRNFPLANPLMKSGGTFVTKVNPTGSALLWSTDLGGCCLATYGDGIALDSVGNTYITGYTQAIDFPTVNPFQSSIGASQAAFVSRLYLATPTTTTITSSVNPSIYGQTVNFSATVGSAMGAPPDSETVTFERGTVVLGTAPLIGGTATFSDSTLAVGTNYIKAIYSGDANFATSTSTKVNQVVTKATTTIVSSVNPSNSGQSVTFTATVVGQFGGTVTGTVTFTDGTTTLATVHLSGGTAKYTTSKLTLGVHTITATYNGSMDFTGSSAALTQTVN